MYIKGFVDITVAAVRRLNELGIKAPYMRSRGAYDSFTIPEEFSAEFHYKCGNPANRGDLRLTSEQEKVALVNRWELDEQDGRVKDLWRP